RTPQRRHRLPHLAGTGSHHRSPFSGLASRPQVALRLHAGAGSGNARRSVRNPSGYARTRAASPKESPGGGLLRDVSLEELAEAAAAGEVDAADALARALLDDVYRLAVRMLWHPEDAEDATQEIMLKVLTHLSEFRRESALRTWVFRIAVNHLLS